MRAFLFILVVVPTGWTFGYLLARLTEGQESVSPAGILLSLGAVLMPALMALLLFTRSERRALLKQVRGSFGALAYLVAVGFPVLVYVAGAVPPLFMAPGSTSLMPASSTLLLVPQMLPMMLLWGALEEIGWRAFLVPELSRFVSGLEASLFVGFLWGLWHAPQIFFSSLPYDGAFRDRPFLGAALWIGATVAYGGVLGWLQLRTGSFVLPALAHALVNVCGSVFAEGLGDTVSPVWAGTGGLAAIFASALLVCFLFTFHRPPDHAKGSRISYP